MFVDELLFKTTRMLYPLEAGETKPGRCARGRRSGDLKSMPSNKLTKGDLPPLGSMGKEPSKEPLHLLHYTLHANKANIFVEMLGR